MMDDPAQKSVIDDLAEKLVMVDLDGTLAQFDGWKGEFTPIGEPITDENGWTAKAFCEAIQQAGYQLIIWTVRGHRAQIEAWLRAHDIPYDGINIRPGQPPGSSDKACAAAYVDDRAVGFRGSYLQALAGVQHLVNRGADPKGPFVETLWEFEGCKLGWYCEGHVGVAEFLRALAADHGWDVLIEYDVQPKHVFWRLGPDPEWDGEADEAPLLYLDVAEGQTEAEPYTYAEINER